MGPSLGGGTLRLEKRRNGWIGMLLLVFLATALFSPRRAEGRLLNLGGSADLTYGYMRTTQDSIENQQAVTKSHFFQQRYNLNDYGDILDPRLGTFSINGTFFSQDGHTNGDFADQNFNFTDYSVAMNLFPYISPLSLYAQRVSRSNDLDVVVKDTVTTYGANWSLSVPRLPRLSLSYNQSELKANDPNRFPDQLNRYFNAESSGRIGDTTLIGRYQFNQTDVGRIDGDVGTIRGQGVNLTTETRLSSALNLSTFTRWANISGTAAPGLTFSQERGISASLFYTPSVFWDTHAQIEYAESPDTIDLKRLLAAWSGSLRPTELVDMVASVRLFQFEVGDTKTTSPFSDFNLNYRPFFGLGTGVGTSVGETKTEGFGASTESFYQRYRGYVNYTRSIEIIRYTASYALSYGTADTSRNNLGDPNKDKLKDLMNTVTLGVENTQIRIVHVALAYTYNDINRSSPTVQPEDDQRSHVFQVNVDSNYFRGLVFLDDSLLLQSSSSLTRIHGFGPEGNTFMFDLRGSYYFFGGGLLSAGWTRQDYPSGFYLDSNLFFEEIQWNFYLGRSNITLSGRDGHQRGDGNVSLDRDTLELTTLLTYQIGKFIFNVDYRWANDRTAGVGYRSETFFARATRIF
ncbi:MAG: hypothetical protein HY282_01340 [Nitrospirae bacterium]|nr:hypothetical protein [Candidatus Manganitrophaceae bacterium]